MLNKIKKFGKTILLTIAMVMAMAMSAFANADLTQLTSEMTGAVTTISTQGLIIVGAVIGVAITFFGGKWLWNMFRGWMSRAQ